MHPTAIPNNRSGAFGMRAGDRVRYTLDGRTGIADEFLSDGEAFVSFDDGSLETVKWNHLEPVAVTTPEYRDGALADWLRTQRHDHEAALAAERAERDAAWADLFMQDAHRKLDKENAERAALAAELAERAEMLGLEP